MSRAEVAEILLTAAHLIDQHGLHRYDYWPNSSVENWVDGLPVCLAGSLAVAAGYDNVEAAANALYGALPDEHDGLTLINPHPALTAVMTFLDVNSPEKVFGFSDGSSAEIVTYTLRGCAAELAGDLE